MVAVTLRQLGTLRSEYTYNFLIALKTLYIITL